MWGECENERAVLAALDPWTQEDEDRWNDLRYSIGFYISVGRELCRTMARFNSATRPLVGRIERRYSLAWRCIREFCLRCLEREIMALINRLLP